MSRDFSFTLEARAQQCEGLTLKADFASAVSKPVRQLGVWSVVLATVFSIGYGVAMFVMGNPHSIFWALMSDYVFMNLAMLFAAPVFEGGKLERWIRWLFLGNGASAVITLFGIVMDSPMIFLLGSLVPWCIIFSLATALVAALFRRIEPTV